MISEKKIGDVFKVTSGGTPSRRKQEYFKNGTIPWVKTGDLKGKYANEPKEYITELALANSSAKIFPKNTVLLAMYGATIGACSILKIAAATNQACAAILPSEKCYHIYLYYYLKSINKELISKGVGGAQPNISGGIIKSTKIPLPPLDQQKKIADILDAADAYRQKTKALIKKYDELTQSLFLDMFGDLLESNDSLTTLEELCGKGKYGSGASATEYIKGSPRYIRITDINEDGSLNDKVVSPDEFDDQYLLSKNDLVFARTGATVGKTYLYDEKDGDLIYAGYLIKFKIPEPHNAKYFFQFTKTQRYKAWVNNQQNVVAQPNINAKQYGKELQIPVPPIDLQNQFAERVQAIEEQKVQAQASLAQSEDLFNSLLQRAFKGELTS
jgi:type I restriction enzyme, S subunit